MLEANPELTPLEVKKIIQETATNMPGYEAWEVGAGHINAYAAVAGALGYDNQNSVTVNNLSDFNANAITLADADPQPFEVLYSPVGEPEVHRFNVNAEDSWINVSSEVFATTTKLKLEAPDGTVYTDNFHSPSCAGAETRIVVSSTGSVKLPIYTVPSGASNFNLC